MKKGRILIGGADIRHIPTEELMSKISVVFQKVYLFEDTIFNNIRFGKPTATLEEVRTAAKAARCDDFIMALPEGYDTLVQEGGNNLSGGEKQRISIARAILKDAPIIILDETTSALDTENEHEVLAAIEELTENKTVIMIAHRIKTVEKADHIIAIEDGRIVQEGTHNAIKNQGACYNPRQVIIDKAMNNTLMILKSEIRKVKAQNEELQLKNEELCEQNKCLNKKVENLKKQLGRKEIGLLKKL